MKEKLTLRNLLICCAAFLAVLFFCLSFAVNMKGNGSEGGHALSVTFKGIIWGCKEVVGEMGGATMVVAPSVIFEGAKLSSLGLNIFGFLGVLFPLLAAIGAVVVLFVVKNEKVKKFVLLGCALLFVVGGVFQFLIVPGAKASTTAQLLNENPDVVGHEEELKLFVDTIFKELGAKLGALSVISGIFTILGGCAVAASQFVPEKKLVK